MSTLTYVKLCSIYAYADVRTSWPTLLYAVGSHSHESRRLLDMVSKERYFQEWSTLAIDHRSRHQAEFIGIEPIINLIN